MSIFWRRVLALMGAALLVMQGAAAVSADDGGAARGTFLYKILRFVDWPGESFGSDSDPIVACIISAEAVAESMRSASGGKRIRGRALEVRSIGDHSEMDGCQVVYSGASKKELRALVAALAGQAILSVSGERDFAEWGGAVSLGLRRGKIDFAVNRKTIDDAGIRISAKLMQLARLVD